MKLLLLGESSVGKTSLVTLYASGVFEPAHKMLTIGIEVQRVSKTIGVVGCVWSVL